MKYFSRSSSCTRKIRHETKEQARDHAGEILRKDGHWLGEYQCRYCGGWHVGHIPTKAPYVPPGKRVRVAA